MQSQANRPKRAAGYVIYILGAMTAFLLLTLSAWGDVEAGTFENPISPDERLATLRCPAFITEDETGVISARIINTTDREVTPVVQARWTQGYLSFIHEQREKLEIPAGESRSISFEITAKDAAYRRLILARVYQLQNFSLPSRSSSCGVVLLPISGPTGQQVFIAAFAASIVLMAAGLLLLRPNDKLARQRQDAIGKRVRTSFGSLIYLGSYFLIGALLTLIGNWLLSGGLFLMAVISIIGVFSYLLSGQQ